MTLKMKMNEQYEAGIETGKELGIELGIETGRELGMEQGKAIGAELGRSEANILAVVRMLEMGNDEAKIKEYYPDEFEIGKEQFLQK